MKINIFTYYIWFLIVVKLKGSLDKSINVRDLSLSLYDLFNILKNDINTIQNINLITYYQLLKIKISISKLICCKSHKLNNFLVDKKIADKLII